MKILIVTKVKENEYLIQKGKSENEIKSVEHLSSTSPLSEEWLKEAYGVGKVAWR